MKSTGVTRKIDELGRIVIPKEIRKNLGIRDGASLEIFIDEESIILKKHFEVRKYKDLGINLSKVISNIYKVEVIITDREKIVVSTETKEIVNKRLNNFLLDLIDEREIYISSNKDVIKLEQEQIEGFFTIVPIIAQSDSLGLVIIKSDTINTLDNLAKVISQIIANKIEI